MGGNERWVYRRRDGKWVNKRVDADRASSVHDTQRGAGDAAHSMLKRAGGGELTIKGRDGTNPQQGHGRTRPRSVPTEGYRALTRASGG